MRKKARRKIKKRISAVFLATALLATSITGSIIHSRNTYAGEGDKIKFAQGEGTGSDFDSSSWKFVSKDGDGHAITDAGKKTEIITNPYGDHENVIRLINGVKSKTGSDLGIEDVSGGSYTAYRVGEAFLSNPIKFNSDSKFSMKFTCSMPDATVNPEQTGGDKFAREYGGDGIAFVMTTNNTHDVNAGRGIGYQGINNSLAIELDSFYNGTYYYAGGLLGYENWDFDNQCYFHKNWDYNGSSNYGDPNPFHGDYVQYRNWFHSERFDHVAIVENGDITKHKAISYINGIDPTVMGEYNKFVNLAYYDGHYDSDNMISMSESDAIAKLNDPTVKTNKESNRDDCATRFADKGVNNRLFTVWVDYDGSKMNVYYANGKYSEAVRPDTPQISQTVDMTGFNGKNVYMGFTSAVGSSKANHTIHSFSFTNVYTADYKVEHYFQNAPGSDSYTINDSYTETKEEEVDTVVKDTEFKKTVANYEYANVEGKSVPQITVKEDGTSVLKLYYKLKTAPYKVEHYFQDSPGSSNYTLNPEYNQTVTDALVGSVVKDTLYKKTVTGYDYTSVTGKSIPQITVKEDGTSVLKLYYNLTENDKASYLLKYWLKDKESGEYKLKDTSATKKGDVGSDVKASDVDASYSSKYSSEHYVLSTVKAQDDKTTLAEKDKTYEMNVYYDPEEAEYEIKYYKKNPVTNVYELADKSEIRKGYVGSEHKAEEFNAAYKTKFADYKYVNTGDTVDKVTLSKAGELYTMNVYYDPMIAYYQLEYYLYDTESSTYKLKDASEIQKDLVGTKHVVTDVDSAYKTKYPGYVLKNTTDTVSEVTLAEDGKTYVMKVYYEPEKTGYKLNYHKYDPNTGKYVLTDYTDVYDGILGSTYKVTDVDSSYANKYLADDYVVNDKKNETYSVTLSEKDKVYEMDVYYDPKIATYKTEYYLQQDDGTYKLVDSVPGPETYSGKTVDAEEKTYPNYVHVVKDGMSNETDVVRADNSTTLKVYYDKIPAKYTVKYYLQDKTNPKEYIYQEKDTVSKNSTAGTLVKDTAYVKTYTDYKFTTVEGKSIPEITVKEDGTSELKLYYILDPPVYAIEYYIEKEDGTFELVPEYSESGIKSATGEKVKGEHIDIPGYVYTVVDTATDKTNDEDIVKSDSSTVLKLYYKLDKPVETKYTVKYYLQDKDNPSEYICREEDTVSVNSEAGAVVKDTAYVKDYTDYKFTTVEGKSISEITVKEDGTSELKLYYNLDPPVYAIQYYIEKEDGTFELVTEYSESGIKSSTGKTVTGEHIDIDGYIYVTLDTDTEKTNDVDTVKSDSSTILKLYYKLPKYKVQYYVENEDGGYDLYTESVGKDKVAAEVNADIIKIKGYKHVLIEDSNEEDLVAADESTVLKVYYRLKQEETTIKETTTKETTTKETTTEEASVEEEKIVEEETSVEEETIVEEETSVEEVTVTEETEKPTEPATTTKPAETTTAKPAQSPKLGDTVHKALLMMLFSSAMVATICVFAKKRD